MKKIFLPILTVIALFGLSACNSAESSDKPVKTVDLSIDDSRRCHQCGMMITKYPGPKGVITINGQDETLAFCSSRDMFQFALQPQNQRQIETMHVHDMGKTEWSKPDDKAFIDASSAVYVYGTTAKAVMGPAVVPFSSKEAAEEHIAMFGGKLYSFKEITLDLLEKGAMGGGHHHKH
ncbi:nitrous oxide reductase accessory protein NosL [Ferrimonas lipolytica]|uniref:nitrous oxide reductase accessory protein NosL n=1 Tax=Ferrimonas lipolytica TaxID=2724191 RepID=UPI001EE9E959|nr:nitrous oxide reductase accessory protein NosL [Ferrimonas lipolytica]